MAKIAVLGFGVVGSGTVELFYANKDSICKKAGKDLDIKYILDLRDFPDSVYKDKLIKDFNIILNDDEIEIVAEVIGGATVAYNFTKALLEKGKSVVTSNKELVATHGAELLQIAKEKGCNYMFEASVGGGIPIIRPLHQCLAGNKIEKIAGILNGTTNFILTKMFKEQMSFEDALKMAQELGYAEQDPTADVEGHDACRKICILGSLAFGKHIYPEYVHCSGISKITADDVAYAENAGYAIKLVGVAKEENERLVVMVSPRLVEKSNLLASVEDVFNAIFVTGDGVGDVMFYGRGAGKMPTASAVVGDIIDCAKADKTSVSQTWADSNDANFIMPYKQAETSMYIRVTGEDVENHKAEISEIFSKPLYIERNGRPQTELAFITTTMPESEIDKKIEAISSICTVSSKIRLL